MGSTLVDAADAMRLIQVLLEQTLEWTEFDLAAGDEKPALDFLLAAREAHRLTGDVARIAEDMLVSILGDRRRAVVDGHSLEVRRAYRRTDWEHSKLATHVALRALGGEVVEGMDVVIDALLKAARLDWRVTALRELDLSEEEYCERQLGRPTVSVVG